MLYPRPEAERHRRHGDPKGRPAHHKGILTGTISYETLCPHQRYGTILTLSSSQLNLPHTYIYNNFEGADLQKRGASCPMPSTQQPLQSQPQQPQQPSRQTYESQELYYKKSMPISHERHSPDWPQQSRVARVVLPLSLGLSPNS